MPPAPITPAPPVLRGFSAPCPKCGKDTVSIFLDNLDVLHCHDCQEDFDLGFVRALVADWSTVLAWIDLAPAKE